MVDDVPARKRWRLSRSVVLFAGIFTAATLVAGAVGLAVYRHEQSDATVTFEAWGSGAVAPAVIWRTPVAGQSQDLSRQALPWSTTVKVAVREGPLFLHGVGRLDSRFPEGAFHCRILVNGAVLEEAGPGSDAQCFTTLQRAFTAR